ncbi:MAG: tripartite tricarboxylate transporter substrate binding protein [Comamonadaceae bacterium]|nr:MAG: tripartite tricarboxylate transporter substrate binding protein [Comamonadaceae bacterium]
MTLKTRSAAGIALSVAAALSLALPVASYAQNFPNKPVRIIVPQTPGGASDALARIVGQKLSEKWGQPVVIENKPGAGGNIGMDTVAKAPGDGYTLLMSYVGSHAINVSIYKKLPFDPEADFTAVATLANVPFVAAANAALPVSNIKELAAYAAKNPVSFGSAGNGSVNHLLGEMFNSTSQIKMQHVPYKGAAPALTDLISGQIQLVFTSLPSVSQHIKSGTVKGLGVTGSKRAQSFKDIPTIAESGYPSFVINPWFGLFAGKNTPPAIVNKINADVRKVLEEKDTMDKFAALGAEPYETTPQEFASILHNDIRTWAVVVKASGATAD